MFSFLRHRRKGCQCPDRKTKQGLPGARAGCGEEWLTIKGQKEGTWEGGAALSVDIDGDDYMTRGICPHS